jgi:pyruvate-formate lyase
MVDSLTAVRQICFREKSMCLSDLVSILDDNFYESEELRQMMLHRIPKYGNDSDEADDLAVRLINYFAYLVQYYNEQRQDKRLMLYAGVGTFEGYADQGGKVGATPDGRMQGAPLSSNASPSLGCAVEGYTATVNSFTKLKLEDLPIGSPLDLNIGMQYTMGDKGLRFLKGLVTTFLEKGGNMLTISVNDVEELRKAQHDPANYRDLIVHVAGWQAYFTDLTPELQEFYIQRLLEEKGNSRDILM